METILKSTSLARRAYWLVKLRWLAVALLVSLTLLASEALKIDLQKQTLYSIAFGTFLYNITLYVLLGRVVRSKEKDVDGAIGRIITLQVSADLFILTAILYYSGSVENPFMLYFVFHMIIASMLLSPIMSYCQATLAVVLFGGLLGLEYLGLLRHHSLGIYGFSDLYQNEKFVLAVFSVFSSTMYIVVYMTTSIVRQLRKQQISYEHANSQLKQKDRYRNEYILHITHDLKSHLAAIKSCHDLLISGMVGLLPENHMDLVQRADHRASKCLSFMSTLLKLTKIRMTGQISRDHLPLKNVIFNALAAVDSKAQEKRIDIGYVFDLKTDQVYGNSLMLEDTVTNLLLNAVKYTSEGGRVRLTATERQEDTLLQITDTGIGIPEDEIDKVFSEFYRARNARQIERDGSGLGLSMAREVIERHGGAIWCDSDSSGTVISFTIPKEANCPNTKSK